MTKTIASHAWIRLTESARALLERIVPRLRREPGRRRCPQSWNQRTSGYPTLARRAER